MAQAALQRWILGVGASMSMVGVAASSRASDACVRPGAPELERYARATWLSFVKLEEPASGLPADHIGGDLRRETRAAYTSPTNIAMYLWATLAARDLEIISHRSARRRIARVLESLALLERHEPSGQFYNWYDPATLDKLTTWPEAPNDPVYPFASSVDNGWLASALVMVSNAVPEFHDEAWSLATSMDFASYYDPAAKGVDVGPGLLRGGFWRVGEEPPGSEAFPRGDYSGMGETVVYTGHHNCPPSTISPRGARSRTAVTTAGKKPSRSAPGTVISGWRCSRAPMFTVPGAWCRPGAVACSRP
jgi:uncharacterized protein DUF3131